ncbi:MAG TPA: hypothetical protein VIG97_13470 [Luteimonas sp.]
MYRNDAAAASPRPNPVQRAVPAPRYRARDFGAGYGRSSGYAASRRYAPGSESLPRFRLA